MVLKEPGEVGRTKCKNGVEGSESGFSGWAGLEHSVALPLICGFIECPLLSLSSRTYVKIY